MDQVKIGRFISERRKKARLTQMELAEKLDITDRAVSEMGNRQGHAGFLDHARAVRYSGDQRE